MQRREFMKLSGLSLAAQMTRSVQAQEVMEKPNLIIIIADQRHYSLSKATGYPLDTSPALDRLAGLGGWLPS